MSGLGVFLFWQAMFETYPIKITNIANQYVPSNYGPTFSMMAENDMEPAYPPGACKEFILDSTYYTYSLQTASYVYYHLNSGNYKPVNIKEPKVVVGGTNEVEVKKALDCLSQVEDWLGIPRTIVKSVPESVFLFMMHPRWIIAPPMLSFYGLIIRAAIRQHEINTSFQKTFDKHYTSGYCGVYTDHSYFQMGRPAIVSLLKYGDLTVFEQDMAKHWVSCTDIHNRGIGAWGYGTFRKTMPHWYGFF